MNFIWEPLIQMMRQDMRLEKLHYYVRNNRVSPYMELQQDSLYEKELTEASAAHTDVNPYVRFSELFERFMVPDDLGYTEFSEAFGDVLLHYLADLDIKSGMCKREFYIKFILSDLEKGSACAIEELEGLSVTEKRAIADGLATLYETADFMNCLIGVIHELLPYCQILTRDEEEIVFYMREQKNGASEQRIRLIITLFLPVWILYVIHWEKTFGLTGYDNTMRLGGFVI